MNKKIELSVLVNNLTNLDKVCLKCLEVSQTLLQQIATDCNQYEELLGLVIL